VPLPLVSVLFERGATTADDSAAIAMAVAVYGLGLPAFVIQKILQPLFFAREDTRSPFRYAVVAMVVNALVAVGLAPFIGWIAAAIATSLAAWVMVALLIAGTRPMGEVARFDTRFHALIWRIIAASLAMGACLWVAMMLLNPFFVLAGWRYLALLGLIAVGMISYFLTGQLIGAFRLGEFRRAFQRGGRA
jgi:putative peptidoglycan lipid II flippase